MVVVVWVIVTVSMEVHDRLMLCGSGVGLDSVMGFWRAPS